MSESIYQDAINTFGETHQIQKAIGECGELIAELVKCFTDGNGKSNLDEVAQEIADVEIMMAQLRLIIGSARVEQAKLYKLDRLQGLIAERAQRDVQKEKGPLKPLQLNLKKEWFDAIKSGEKDEEYREFNDFWKKRLMHPDGTPREYSKIIICLGYPKKGDTSRIIEFPWRGFQVKEITHRFFDYQPTMVFAIKLEPETNHHV